MSRDIAETVFGVVQDLSRHGPEQHDLMRLALSGELDGTALWGSLPTWIMAQFYSPMKNRCKQETLFSCLL